MINEQLKLISNIPFQCWVQTFREGGHPNPEMRGVGEGRLKKIFFSPIWSKNKGGPGPSLLDPPLLLKIALATNKSLFENLKKHTSLFHYNLKIRRT